MDEGEGVVCTKDDEPLIVSIERSRRSSSEPNTATVQQSNGEREETLMESERGGEGRVPDEEVANPELITSNAQTLELPDAPPPLPVIIDSEPARETPPTVGTNTPLTATPSKLSVTGLGSPLHGGGGGGECESEVNSVAVEPPSPNRDEISFAVDEPSFRADETTPLSDQALPTPDVIEERDVGVVVMETKTLGKEGPEKEEEGEDKGEKTEEVIAKMEETNRDGASKEEMEEYEEEANREGSTQEESTQEGNTQEGSAQEGSTQEESTQEGSTQEGSAQEESTQEGIARVEEERENEGNGMVGEKEEEEMEEEGGGRLVSSSDGNNIEASEPVDLVVSTGLCDEELSVFPSVQKDTQEPPGTAGASLSPGRRGGDGRGLVGVASDESSNASHRKRQGSATDDNKNEEKIVSEVSGLCVM